MIDIGAMSTAPYLQTHISTAEERRRLVSAIEIVRDSVALPISADTARAEVAAAALSAGATVINDVTGLLGDMGMAEVAADAQGVILMASRDDGAGGAPVARVRRCLERSLEVAARAGIAEDRIVLDPGIGFFTRSGMSGTEFNCAVLRDLAELDGLGLPLLVGVSRKSFLGELTGGREASERLAGSLAATAIAVNNGASAIRTHDVGATLDAIRVASALRQRAKR
jgi:dihydropteroate synthase